MKLLAPVVVATLATALAAASATSRSAAQPTAAGKSPVRPVLGISHRSAGGALAWFDPLTLRMLPGRKAPLGGHFGAWTFSPDRSVFAIGNCGDAVMRELRFVNARSMRVLGELELTPPADCTSSLAWLRPRRLLAVTQISSETFVTLVDPVSRRVLHQSALPSSPWATGRTPDELALLLGNTGSFAPARVAVIDSEGRVRIVTVDRVVAGTVFDDQASDHRARTITPGFAVDPEGRRAFLVPATGAVAEIDLQTLAVSYHELDQPSLLGRFFRWLTPAAEAKSIEGPTRYARWVGEEVLAISGTDYALERDAKGNEIEIGTPVGVRLIDTRSWRSHMLSAGSSGFAVAPGLVIAQGGRWDSQQERTIGPGILAFGLNGDERWRLDQPTSGWLDAHGAFDYGYLWVAEGRMRVVDLTSGATLRTIKRNEQLNPWPQLLDTQSSDW